jgi:hypothetical protein
MVAMTLDLIPEELCQGLLTKAFHRDAHCALVKRNGAASRNHQDTICAVAGKS